MWLYCWKCSGEILSDNEDDGGEDDDDDDEDTYMQKQREKLEAEKEAILNNKNLIAEVILAHCLHLPCMSICRSIYPPATSVLYTFRSESEKT